MCVSHACAGAGCGGVHCRPRLGECYVSGRTLRVHAMRAGMATCCAAVACGIVIPVLRFAAGGCRTHIAPQPTGMPPTNWCEDCCLKGCHYLGLLQLVCTRCKHGGCRLAGVLCAHVNRLVAVTGMRQRHTLVVWHNRQHHLCCIIITRCLCIRTARAAPPMASTSALCRTHSAVAGGRGGEGAASSSSMCAPPCFPAHALHSCGRRRPRVRQMVCVRKVAALECCRQCCAWRAHAGRAPALPMASGMPAPCSVRAALLRILMRVACQSVVSCSGASSVSVRHRVHACSGGQLCRASIAWWAYGARGAACGAGLVVSCMGALFDRVCPSHCKCRTSRRCGALAARAVVFV